MYNARITLEINSHDDIEEVSDDIVEDLISALLVHDVYVDDICVDFE